VTTVREFNLTARFNLNILVGSQVLLKQVHHTDTFVETNHQMETTRVESYTVRLLFEMLINFKIKPVLTRVRPNLDGSINTSGSDKWLLNARIHTVDLAGVERQNQVAVVNFIGRSFHIDVHPHDLLIISREDK